MAKSILSRIALLCAMCNALSYSHGHKDLILSFRGGRKISPNIHAAVLHEMNTIDPEKSYSLACAPYRSSNTLSAFIESYSSQDEYHRVFHSVKEDKSCFIVSGTCALNIKSLNIATVTVIPHILKYDSSIDECVDELAISGPGRTKPMTLEISVGLGVGGKGTSMSSLSSFIRSLLHETIQTSKDFDMLSSHWDRFFWTRSDKGLRNSHEPSSEDAHRFDNLRSIRSDREECPYSLLTVEISKSHVSFVSPADFDPECVRFLATVATLRPDVTYVQATLAATFKGSLATSSEDYSEGDPATDQNAWVQSGSSTSTPYSDIGVDGTGYVLGMIDSGLDDLSCFLIDWSGNQTTRTPGYDYNEPITEPFRRKVIQYIMWGDGGPSVAGDYDHGTWCSGASVGKCINASSNASAYNGVAYNAKITMFDVDIAGTENYLNVPPLYTVALPPAYAAGARVHSNSWTTYYMSSYTTKSLDVDEFMFDNPDFLFIAGAGNSGNEGYNSVTSPAVSKNAITVGASSVDHNNIVYFSSLGSAYDTAFKPNLVTPGRNLMSAGVHLPNQTESCNVQISSGTSMATPIAAGSAILIRHYLENASFWGQFCNASYRSCPVVVPSEDDPKTSDFISAALLRAVLVGSAQPMTKYESNAQCMIPETELGVPPDNFQGWGQVILSSVLPLPGTYDFDLYVSDYEALSSLTRRTYYVNVQSPATPLMVSLAWTDPPNTVWAVKNLLNDLDLVVTAPSGSVHYGNNIKGDEFNTIERVVVSNPQVGIYEVTVTAKILGAGSSQDYGVVITSSGYVDEARTYTKSISLDDIVNSEAAESCQVGTHLVRFQLEDWEEGASWINMSFVIANKSSGDAVYTCDFPPNADQQYAQFNRMHQCSTCLADEGDFFATFLLKNDLAQVPVVARAVSPQCNAFISNYQQSWDVDMVSGQCNACPTGSSLVEILMYANVTDDDESLYSWYGVAYYTLADVSDSPVGMGTLVLSDEEADRYCLAVGTYNIHLNDDTLFVSYGKHALVVVTDINSGVSVTVTGTTSASFSVTTPPPTLAPTTESEKNSNGNDDDNVLSKAVVAGIVIGVLVGVAIIGAIIWFNRRVLCQDQTKKSPALLEVDAA